MSDEIDLHASSSKGVLNYETVVNMHIMRSNQLFQTITSQKGIGIPIIMSLYSTVMALDGLIRNKRQPKLYDEKISEMVQEIKKDFQNLGDSATDDKKFVDAWFKVVDAYNFQLQQMNDLGLTPTEDVDDILPTISEKIGQVVEVPQWKPSPGDFDYKKDLQLPEPQGIDYKVEKERKVPATKTFEEMNEFEKRIYETRIELEKEIAERDKEGE